MIRLLEKTNETKSQTYRYWSEALTRSFTRKLRSIRQFAEEEIILPDDGGPFSGEPFCVETQPYTKLLFNEIDSRRWLEVFVVGTTQSGKTLSGFVIPLLYMLFELGKNPIAAVPQGDMVADKWSVDIEPALSAKNNFRDILPRVGQGSKKGTVKDRVEFANGRVLKFVTAGGSDQSKAGYTAPFIVVTEAARWSDGTATSKEASPLDQIRGRQMSTSGFDEHGNVASDSMLIVEGTVQDDDRLPLSERPLTTESRIACPCVHCGNYVTPGRKHLVGWQDSKSVLDAAKASHWVCPDCSEPIDDAQRHKMNLSAVLLHRGQTISALSKKQIKRLNDGHQFDRSDEIEGDAPPVTKLWFYWNAFNNMFRKAADVGKEEWEASQLEEDTPERENAEKKLSQFSHAEGYTPKVIARERLSKKEIRKRRAKGLNWGTVPSDTVHLVCGIDVGKWDCWYVVLAFRGNGQIHCVAYGQIKTNLLTELGDVEKHEIQAIEDCLLGMFAMCEDGWIVEGSGELRPCDLVLADSGYKPDAVFQAMASLDKQVFFPVLGRGESLKDRHKYVYQDKRSKKIRSPSNRGLHLEYVRKWYRRRIVVNADTAKDEIQNCLRVRKGTPGCLTLAQNPIDDHQMISRHLAAELKDENGKWQKTGANHLLDSAGYAWMGGSYLGWDVRDYQDQITTTEVKQDDNEPKPRKSWLEEIRNAS